MEKISATNITLRLFRSSDAEDFLAWKSNDKVMQFLCRELCMTKQAAIDYISTYIADHPWCRAICVHDRPVGSVNIWPTPDEDRRKASIGYCIRCDHWGRGITTVAVKKVVAAVFEDWPELERLEATVGICNMASQRVLEKAGFKREGMLRKFVNFKGVSRDVYMFSFLSTDLAPLEG